MPESCRFLDKNSSESIHLCDFPEAKEEWINKDLEENMKKFWDVVVLGVHAVIQQISRTVSQSEPCM